MNLIVRRQENRLSKLVWVPGGKTIESALNDAEAGVASLVAVYHASIHSKLTELLEVASQAHPESSQVAGLYQLAVEVADTAGTLTMKELAAGALGLADLLQFCGDNGAWNWPAVQVHARGLLVLADASAVNEEGRAIVLEGLNKVRERVFGIESK